MDIIYEVHKKATNWESILHTLRSLTYTDTHILKNEKLE